MNNLKNLSLAAHLYADDYNDKFPDAINGSATDVRYNYWVAYIRHYLGSSIGSVESQRLAVGPAVSMEFRNGYIDSVVGDVGAQGANRTKAIYGNPFFCPATFGPFNTVIGSCANFGVWTDYGMSLYTGGAPGFGASYIGPKRGTIKYPGRTMLFSDCYGQPTVTYSGWPSTRHSGFTRANVVLVDGHVESCRGWYPLSGGPGQDIFNGSAQWCIENSNPIYTGYNVYTNP